MWSKDIVFVVADGYIDGMQAWLDAYHGNGQSSQCLGGLTSANKYTFYNVLIPQSSRQICGRRGYR